MRIFSKWASWTALLYAVAVTPLAQANSRPACEGIQASLGTSITVELVAAGFKQPVHLSSPPRDPDRLFIVQQEGTIRIIKSGKALPRPFLDIRNRVSTGYERGLLSVGFHPDYETNRRFFVYYTQQDGDLVIAEYTASASDPDVSDTNERRLLVISHKIPNHNGGLLLFGPDRFLYIGTGDGGSQGDPGNNSQNKTRLLGKMLRIDVDKQEQDKPYGIPSSNPFVSDASAAPEIWAYGLRNPWRFSFDRKTGDLYIADVGQNAWEEVDVQPASSKGGENYGWRLMEGMHCFNPKTGCPTDGLTMPVFEYPQRSNETSITGGFVYRGCRMPDLQGTYFYADYMQGFIRTFVLAGGKPTREKDVTRDLTPPAVKLLHLSSFGEDPSGELYLVEHERGEIYRVVPRK